jgi:glycosyltransferase involved in cell wall biosynthesis
VTGAPAHVRAPTAPPPLRLSLVVPCYNEAANIRRGVLDALGAFTADDERFAEVLVVDDGSTDASRDLTAAAARRFPKFGLIENRHQGKALAIITGIRRARQEYVMFSDMDLATPLGEAEKLIAAAGRGYDLVIGSRLTERPGAPLHRKALAWGLLTVRDHLLGLRNLRDTQCGFKLFRRPVALEIIRRLRVFTPTRRVLGSSVSAAFDLEFLLIASQLHYPIKEVPVAWRHVENRSVRVVKDSLEALADIARIAYYARTGGYTRPFTVES